MILPSCFTSLSLSTSLVIIVGVRLPGVIIITTTIHEGGYARYDQPHLPRGGGARVTCINLLDDAARTPRVRCLGPGKKTQRTDGK